MARILFLAPQPFFQERGTPIAVDLALKALEQDGHEIDLVTYPEGEPRSYRLVCHYRVPQVPGIRSISPGFSWKKLIYSFLMIFTAFRLAISNRYTLVHAVEEASFIALLLKVFLGIDYIYDMDSSIAQQLVEDKTSLKCLAGVFAYLERFVVRKALAVVAVCPVLERLAKEYGTRNVLLLQDISLLDRGRPGKTVTDLRSGIDNVTPLLLYVGNLESYQGIDLLLEGFALATHQGVDSFLAIIGGRSHDVDFYRSKAAKLGLTERRVKFFGPRPMNDLSAYLDQADVLVSPRSKGNNTPMKIYTYLDSGKALLATRILSHTQALDSTVAYLVEPKPESIADGIMRLCHDQTLRQRLAQEGKKLVAKKYSWPVFKRSLTEFYRSIITTT